MRKKMVVVTVIMFSLLLTVGCAQQVQAPGGGYEAENTELREQVSELEAEVARLQLEKEKLMGENLGLKVRPPEFEERYEALLRELFSEEELRELAVSKGMRYGLSVNQVPVKGGEVVVAAGDMLAIAVSEGFVMSSDGADSLLPNKILQLAMLDNLSDHVRVESEAEHFTSPGAGTVVWAEGFFFEKAPAGTVVKIVLSEVLRGRLGLGSGEITIRVK